MLSVNDLSKPTLERATKNHETYKMIYTTCAEHIKRKHAAGCNTTIYMVPEFLFGRPTFTQSHAVRYVSDKLRKGGFDVHADGSTMTIDWSKGIRRAIRASSKKTPKKTDVPLSVRLANLKKTIKASR